MLPNLPTTPDNELLRRVLFETVCQQYKNLIDLLNKIVMPPQFRTHAMLNFDQGFLWIKEAIAVMNQQEQALETQKQESQNAPAISDSETTEPKKVEESNIH